MIPKPLRIFLAAEALFTLGYFLLPPSGFKAASYAALGLTAVIAVVTGTRTYRPRRPRAWDLLGSRPAHAHRRRHR